MHNKLDSLGFKLLTSFQPIITAPANTTIAVHTLFITNLTNEIKTVNLRFKDLSSTVTTSILHGLKIPPGFSYYLDRTLNLTPGDILEASADSINSVEMFLSYIYHTE